MQLLLKLEQKFFEAMKDYFCVNYGNPSSIYKIAQKNKAAVDKGREQVAKAINADTNENLLHSWWF